jgi:hypothetical protein
MNVNRLIRWSIPFAFLLATGFAGNRAHAGQLLAQPGLVQALAPATAGFHHRHFGGWGYGGWGGYRGWGSYYYGRPSIYFGAYRPYYRASSYSYAPRYYGSYGIASPYYSNYSYVSRYSSTGFYGNYAAYRPIVYSNPVYTSVYASPVYSNTVYTNPVYTSRYIASSGGVVWPASNYTAYGGYASASVSYPVYATYNTYSPYGACCGCW